MPPTSSSIDGFHSLKHLSIHVHQATAISKVMSIFTSKCNYLKLTKHSHGVQDSLTCKTTVQRSRQLPNLLTMQLEVGNPMVTSPPLIESHKHLHKG